MEAEAFFLSNKAEILAETKVLWPQAETYLDLMKLRLSKVYPPLPG